MAKGLDTFRSAGVRAARGLLASVLAVVALLVGTPAAEAGASRPALPETSPEVRALAQWALATRNAKGRPFAIVDKRQARIHVYGPDGRFEGSAAVLLGMTRGDDSMPGVGDHAQQGVVPVVERTTPAGRFESQPGRNLKGEAIVWVDYESALAIHRLRPANPTERRPQRLDSASPEDNRISLGCIVVSEHFYDGVIAPTLGRGRGVVYVLPETRRWQTEFGLAAAL